MDNISSTQSAGRLRGIPRTERVLSPRGDFTAHAHTADDLAEVGPVDYVFLGLKANAYAACGPLIEPLLHGRTAVVAAQNAIPWWYFHRHGGPYDGHRVESVDPDGAVKRRARPPGVVRHLEGTRFGGRRRPWSVGRPGVYELPFGAPGRRAPRSVRAW